MPPRKSWKRWPTEPDAAYALFSEWLQCADSEGDRADVYSWAEGRAESPEWRSFILRCSDVFKWMDRAFDYDAHQSSVTVRKVYPLISPLLLSIYRIASVELGKYERAQQNAGDAPGFVDIRAVLKMLDVLAKAESKIKDLALKEKEIAQNLGPAEVAVDFSRITVEEHRMLEAIMAKATVPG